ncbi:MAG TPA: NAD-dependent epimerase/dehydratase family protein [Cyclobacteriaceae bacterium]|nr:NAD-dependent epimerase/dehydratase family protein [Cyclobacteriaceae bacterium]
MQTILGANGVIATELSRHLPSYNATIRQVCRHPKKVNESDQLVIADLLDYDQTQKAVAGSEIVYLLAGLKYDIKVWKEQWPKLMKNVIDACKQHGSKLVFFDNVYCYGHVKGTMTEDTPFNPTSKKGEVRAKVATMLLDEIKAGNLQGMIIRAADFYGPGAQLSLTYSTVTSRLKAHKGPQWIGNPKSIHTFTYTPDAGKSVAMLGNTASAYNQTWHALTSKDQMTGEKYVKIACDLHGVPYKLQAMPKFGVSIVGLFVPVLHEFVEMMYQFENDYIFDSSKFEKAFNATATTYEEGIAATLKF